MLHTRINNSKLLIEWITRFNAFRQEEVLARYVAHLDTSSNRIYRFLSRSMLMLFVKFTASGFKV